MELSPEEKNKIYEEEKVRAEAKEKVKQEKKKREDVIKGISTAITLIILIGLGWYLFSIFQTPSETPSSSIAEKPLEYQLAIINAADARTWVPEDHITVARFRTLLKRLSSTFKTSEQDIADATAMIKSQLAEEGIVGNLLEIMEGMNQISPTKNQSYVEYASAYVVLRKEGVTHEASLNVLEDALQRLKKLQKGKETR